MAIFEKLYALQGQFERESERLELMLGDGRIRWRTREGFLLDYPVLLLRLQILFDPKIPEFSLIETGQPSEFYTAIFQSIAEVNASAIGRCRDDHEQGEWHPLGAKRQPTFSGGWSVNSRPMENLSNSTLLRRQPHLLSLVTP